MPVPVLLKKNSSARKCVLASVFSFFCETKEITAEKHDMP